MLMLASAVVFSSDLKWGTVRRVSGSLPPPGMNLIKTWMSGNVNIHVIMVKLASVKPKKTLAS